MDAAYVKVDGGAPVPGHLCADPGLACWAALVHAWDGIDAALDDDDAAAGAAAATAHRPVPHDHAALTDLRPFG